MKIRSEEDITNLICADAWMMDVLRAAQKLDLPDWWIGAGFLRNKVWDAIENKQSEPTRDVDLVYFDEADTARETDYTLDEKMKHAHPFAEWEIRNQARMHYVNGFASFTSAADGISHWVETATCVAVKLDADDLRFLFCYGTDDLYELVARPTPYFKSAGLIDRFHTRVEEKKWQARWPNLRFVVD